MADDLELLNDGPSFLAIIADCLKVYNDTYAIGPIRFRQKPNSNWRLVLGDVNNFHLLSDEGAPVAVLSIADNGHHTTSSGLITVRFAATPLLKNGSITLLASNDTPGVDNSVWIDAR